MLAASEQDLNRYLTPKFQEPDLILSTSRALGSIENADVHELWSGILDRLPALEFVENPLAESDMDLPLDRYPPSSEEFKILSYMRALKSSLRFDNDCRIGINHEKV